MKTSTTTTTATRTRIVVLIIILLVFISLLLSWMNTTTRNNQFQFFQSPQVYYLSSSSSRRKTQTATPKEKAANTIVRSTMMTEKNNNTNNHSSSPSLFSPSSSSGTKPPQQKQQQSQKAKVKEPNKSDSSSNSNSNSSSFSACLLTMDDNHKLPEWLAYHYYALKLRYLVVAIDPHSKTSPLSIFDKWKDYIEIIVWGDENFAKSNLTIDLDTTPVQRINKHRIRQQNFYRACITHMKSKNKKWTAFIDTDEFLTINTDVLQQVIQQHAMVGVDEGGGNESSSVSTQQRFSMSRPGSVLRIVEALSNATSSSSATASSLDMLQDAIPNGTILARDISNNNTVVSPPTIPSSWLDHFQQSCCVTIARALYSAVESSDEEINNQVPNYINATQFDTLRFRYRGVQRGGLGIDSPGKSIIDVSRVSPRKDFQRRGNAHRPLTATCPGAWYSYNSIPLGIHHYLGSWESYSYRSQDARRDTIHTYEAWKKRSTLAKGGPDDGIRPWISGFVSQVGIEQAKYLLQGAGVVLEEDPAPSSNTTTAINSQMKTTS